MKTKEVVLRSELRVLKNDEYKSEIVFRSYLRLLVPLVHVAVAH